MPFRIEHRIGVQAPPSQVWGLLADLEGWKTWNPLYPEASGRLSIGAPISVTLALPGRAPERLTPVVLDWSPESLIHWRLKRWGGLLQTIRYLEIQTLSDTACVFSNGELFEGVGANFVPRQQRAALRKAFTELGEAMKARAEANWRASGQASQSA